VKTNEIMEHTQTVTVDPEGKLGECFLEPFGNRVVVTLDSFVYHGRLVIPEAAQRAPTTGVIVELGPDVDGTKFAKGDRVAFNIFSGTLMQFQNKPLYRILSTDELLCKVKSDVPLEYTAA